MPINDNSNNHNFVWSSVIGSLENSKVRSHYVVHIDAIDDEAIMGTKWLAIYDNGQIIL